MTTANVAATATESRKLRKIVFATSAGTIFEAYDFILFGSLAPLIASQFFAGVNETTGFIFALLTFAAGFAVRPLGALVFGRMGDKEGRKKAFLITITLMGLATFAIGLLPTYASVGIWAPILLITLRLIQGLAFGGEYGGAVVYTAEHAPAHQRGLYVGWIQAAAGFALFMSFLVIYLTRTIVGEENFAAWGWRIPFLISIALLAISLWIRMSLEESPMFKKMQEEGKVSKRPLKEAFGEWANVKLVLIVLFGLMSLQGVLFYTAHFYSQFFLSQILKMPSASITFIMMVVTCCSVPLYVLFSWLSDKVGRKRIIMTGAIMSALTMVPLFYALTSAVNPALVVAQENTTIVVIADPAQCSLQFDPVGQANFISSCDIAKSTLARLGLGYSNEQAAAGTLTTVQIGEAMIESIEGGELTVAELATGQLDFENRIIAGLNAVAYPLAPDPDEINTPLITGLILLLVIFAVMVYAPMPTMALEVFPTRIRYSALSLPYHIGSGWFGGFLPAIAFAMVAANGNIYFGLWYPMVVTVIGILVLAFLLPETRDRDIQGL
ncbi:MFS transporter [Gammaproteobacteria bacterium]|nr:MFS transporter [Gammaproteobacteria bacterium]